MASPLKRRHSLSYQTGNFLCIMGFRVVFFLNVLSPAWVTYEFMHRASSSQDFRWTIASITFPRYHCDSLSFNATLRSSRFVVDHWYLQWAAHCWGDKTRELLVPWILLQIIVIEIGKWSDSGNLSCIQKSVTWRSDVMTLTYNQRHFCLSCQCEK